MNVLSIACLAGAAVIPLGHAGLVLVAGLAIVVFGSVLTTIRRTRHLIQELDAR